MIIHLKGKVQNNKILFDLVPYRFVEHDFIQVNQVIVKLNRPASNVFMTISSSLVDQSQYNPTQQIIQFCCYQQGTIIFHEPTQSTKYKIQRNDLETAEFILSTDKKIDISEIYLQIEIINARLQYINQ